jgi:hypothetical protein
MTHKYVTEVQVGEKIIVEKVKTVIKVEQIMHNRNNGHFQTMVTFSDGTCEVYEKDDTVAVKVKQNEREMPKRINSVGDLIEAQVVESPIFVVLRQEL